MDPVNYLDTQYNLLSPQRRIVGPRFEIPPGEEYEFPVPVGYVSSLDPFWEWYFLIGGLFMVAGFLYGVGLLVAMLIWM